MKILKVIGASVAISLVLGLNALTWVAVGEKYNTMQTQEAVLMNLHQQLRMLEIQNTILQQLTPDDPCPFHGKVSDA